MNKLLAPYPNEHSARLLDPKTTHVRVTRTDGSGGGTVQGVKIPKTIAVIWYVVKREKKEVPVAQALRFPTKKWTEKAARAWLKEHEIEYILFEPAGSKEEKAETMNLLGRKESPHQALTAFALVATAVEFHNLEAAAVEGEETRKRPSFLIRAYNGGALNLGYWGRVIIDLEGLRAANVAVLKDHDPGQIVGTGTAKITKQAVDVSGIITGDYEAKGEPAEIIVSQSRNGFPWQASVGVSVDRYEVVEAGEKVTVNGRVWKGPITVTRSGRLGEVSLLAVGADENSNARIAARAVAAQERNGHMNEEEKVEEQTVTQEASHDNEQQDSTREDDSRVRAATIEAETTAAVRKTIAREQERVGKIEATCRGDWGDKADEVAKLKSRAISGDLELSDLNGELLKILRGMRPQAPNVAAGIPHDLGPVVLEAAMLMGAGKKIDTEYPAPVLEAAHRQFRHGLGIGKLLCMLAEMATGERYDLQRDGVPKVMRAAFSTADVAAILSNVANKYLLDGYSYGENADLKIARIAPVRDFKQKTSYRLQSNGEFEKVPPGGPVSYGTLNDQSFTNQADTYGIIFGLDRRQLINDDLGAFENLQTMIGQGAALSRQKVFWTEFLYNEGATFFASGNSNVATGSGSVLSMDAMTAAILLMRMMNDGADTAQPINVQPWGLLVPAALEGTAWRLFKSSEVRDTTASTKTLIANIYEGRFEPIVSRYLDDAVMAITNYSATAWYLLADPRMVPTIEICFLNGVQTPTIESVNPTVDFLGIQMRGYLDFGVNMQDPRGGIRSAGA